MTIPEIYVEIGLLYPNAFSVYYQAMLEDLKVPPNILTDNIMQLNTLNESAQDSYYLLDDTNLTYHDIPQQKVNPFGMYGGVFDFTSRKAVARFSIVYLDTPIRKNGEEKRFILALLPVDSDEPDPLTYNYEYLYKLSREITKAAITKLRMEREVILMAGEFFLTHNRFPSWFVKESTDKMNLDSGIMITTPGSKTIN